MKNRRKIGEMIKGMLSVFRSRKLGLEVVKKSELINGKKIEVQIYLEPFNSVNGKLMQEFKEIIWNKEDLKHLMDFHKNFLSGLICNMTFKSFFDVCKEFWQLIPSDNLQIRVVFSDTQRNIGIFHHYVSGEDYAFFSFYTYYAIAQAYKMHSLNDNSLIRIMDKNRGGSVRTPNFEHMLDFVFPNSGHAQYMQDFRTTIQHEFMHYLDLRQMKSRDEIILRMHSKIHPSKDGMRAVSLTPLLTPETLVNSINQLREEGLATFGQSRKLFMNYNLKLVREFKSWINHYSRGPIIPDGAVNKKEMYYDCGGYICYFISLFIIAKKGQHRINELRAFFDKKGEDFVFLNERFENIFRLLAERGLEEIYFQMPPKSEIDETIREITNFSHLQFIKIYEEACETLQVPKEHVLLTLADYKVAKKKCYVYWIENIRREGFPTDGIKEEIE